MEKWDQRYLEMAKLVGSWSKDPSTKVGSVIVAPDRRVISVGFNGFSQCMPDVQAHYQSRDEKYSRIIHAEINALLFAERSVAGCTVYTHPFIPCDRCFVQLVQAGIVRFVSVPPSAEQESRWGSSFDRVRTYAAECRIELLELS